MEHIVKLRKIALADIEAEQLKLKAAKEANRKRAASVVKVLNLRRCHCSAIVVLCQYRRLIRFAGEARLHDWRLGAGFGCSEGGHAGGGSSSSI
jgi:hypothetical protein